MSKMKKWIIGIGIFVVIGAIGSIFSNDDAEVSNEEPNKNIEANTTKETMSNEEFEKEVNFIEPNLEALENNKLADINTVEEMITKSEASSSYIVKLKANNNLNEDQEAKLDELNNKFNDYTVHYYSQKNELKKNK